MKILLDHNITSVRSIPSLQSGIEVEIYEHWRDISTKQFGHELSKKPAFAFGSFNFTFNCERSGTTRLDVLDDFKQSYYHYRINNALLNNTGRYYPARVSWQELAQDFGATELFVKPNHPCKLFESKVYNEVSFESLRSISPSEMIFVDHPRPILCECRYFKLGSQFLYAGFYKCESADLDFEAISLKCQAFLQEIAQQLPSCCVVDLAYNTNTPVKIVELNSIHNSGFYAMDMQAFAETLQKYVNENS